MPFFVTARTTKKLQVMLNRKATSLSEAIPLDLEHYFYLRNWAVSAYEKWGLNTNADGWKKENLMSDYSTFDGSWVCLNHVAENSNDSIGSVIHPAYTPEDYVENILAVDREKARRKGYPYLEKDIKDGRITDTSMGCLSRASECTVCHNIAYSDKDYCDHLKKDKLGHSQKGRSVLINGRPRVIGELYIDTMFIEDSILTNEDGADINAKIFNIAAHRTGAGIASDENLYFALKAVAKEFPNSAVINRFLDTFDKFKS